MNFKSLKEKCEYFRELSDTKLIPNMPVLLMLDGHCFSKLVKTRYELPFDDTFIDLMDETAAHLCSKIQGAVFAYTQSDEISIFVKDYSSPESDSFFGYRACKLLSLLAAEASAFFNRRLYEQILDKADTVEQAKSLLKELPLMTFDCKAWNVPTENDVFAWFLYRQNDCVRNSKQQFAQTYLPHDTLKNNTTDVQIALVKETNGLDWHELPDNKKFGRIIYKELVHGTVEIKGETIDFERNVYLIHPAQSLNENPEKLRELISYVKS